MAEGNTQDQGVSMPRWTVWFDPNSEQICLADRQAAKADGLKPGEPVPEKHIIRVPLAKGEIFIGAVMNAVAGDADVAAVLSGSLRVADYETLRWMGLSEDIRHEFERRGAGVEAFEGRVQVNADELARLRKLEAVCQRLGREDLTVSDIKGVARDLRESLNG
jgi:hypothetical protein